MRAALNPPAATGGVNWPERATLLRWLLWLAPTALVLAALALRLWALDGIPVGLYVDEASIGVNAGSILETGRDEHGKVLPLYFKAFGEYKNPVHIYATAGLFGLFGVSAFTLRLASVLFYIAGLALGLALVARFFPRERGILIFAALGFGFVPSLFVLSRVSFEVMSSFPLAMAVLLAAHAFTTSRSEDSRTRLAVLLGLLLGAWLYTYSTIRMSAHLTLVLILVLLGERRARPALRMMVLAFLVASVPMAAILIGEPTALFGRFKAISYIDGPASIAEKAKIFLHVYALHWSPSYLLLEGDPNLRHAIGTRGAVFFVTLLLAIVGGGAIALGGAGLRNRFSVLLLLLALAAPVPAALTVEDVPNSIRAHLMAPYLVLLSCYGFVAVTLWARAAGRAGTIAAALSGVLAVEAASFVAAYFTAYPERSAPWMGSLGLKETLARGISEAPDRLVLVAGDDGTAANFRFALLEQAPPPGVAVSIERAPDDTPGTCTVGVSGAAPAPAGLTEPRLLYRPDFTLGPSGAVEGGPVASFYVLRCH